jgi:threonine aldolase
MRRPIDLRSDTVTRPSDAMRAAIARAEVGDDVWGEDPTVAVLEERVASLLGKEAGLFVPSGTMANQVAIRVHTSHGDEILVGQGAHCIAYEGGAPAAISGVMAQAIGRDGLFRADEVAEAIHPENVHFPPTTLVWIENTHNRGGGRVFPQAEVEAIAAVAHARGLRVHLDGARLLNAAAATERPARELAAPADSASICLSKGLGAPVGSVLAGSRAFVASARRYRKMLGGGMRQVGILAAAGLYALDHNTARLTVDHENAALLARGLECVSGVALPFGPPETNIVILDLLPPAPVAEAVLGACAERGLLLSSISPARVRAVTHLDVTREECEAAVGILREVLTRLP